MRRFGDVLLLFAGSFGMLGIRSYGRGVNLRLLKWFAMQCSCLSNGGKLRNVFFIRLLYLGA